MLLKLLILPALFAGGLWVGRELTTQKYDVVTPTRATVPDAARMAAELRDICRSAERFLRALEEGGADGTYGVQDYRRIVAEAYALTQPHPVRGMRLVVRRRG